MNIVFEKIKWKNFLSYNKTYTEVKFENGIDLLMGKNGAGKSSINEAIFYSLFGKPFRKIKGASLINRVNKKQMQVQIDFSIDSIKYRIIRGMKPAKFEIYKANSKKEYVIIKQKAATKDYQIMLEEEILCLNETIFRQLIVLGANLPSSKPFMELSNSEKENLFQAITDTSIFNLINASIKEKVSTLKSEIKDLEYKREITESTIKSENIIIEEAEKRNEYFKTKHSENIKSTKDSILDLETKIEKHEIGITKLKELKISYDKLLDSVKIKKDEFEEAKELKIKTIEKEIESLNNEYKEKIRELYNNKDSINKVQALEDDISKINKQMMDLSTESNILSSKISNIKTAEEGSIECNNCSSINYLTDIDHNEIKNKDKYIKNIKDNNAEIKSLEEEIIKIKESIVLIKKEELSIIEEEKNKIHLDFTVQTNNLSDKIVNINTEKLDSIEEDEKMLEMYKEKLLNAKRIKENLEGFKKDLERHTNNLLELNNIQEVQIDYSHIKEKENALVQIKENQKISKELNQNLDELNNLIGSNNLKGAVIKRQIPFLNKSINHFLELFSMIDYSFVIDENFKERIISRDEDSEFNQLSNGQKSRISFSIMFAFLKIIEKRNGVKTNLLILDEILDSSIDSDGREELLSILNDEFSSVKDVIIISHNPEIKEKIEMFDRMFNITRDKYSNLTVEYI